MTKLYNVKVVVPVDDDVHIDQFIRTLTQMLADQPVQSFGEAQRVHWQAVSVYRWAERAAPGPRAPAQQPARKRPALPPQSELPSS